MSSLLRAGILLLQSEQEPLNSLGNCQNPWGPKFGWDLEFLPLPSELPQWRQNTSSRNQSSGDLLATQNGLDTYKPCCLKSLEYATALEENEPFHPWMALPQVLAAQPELNTNK